VIVSNATRRNEQSPIYHTDRCTRSQLIIARCNYRVRDRVSTWSCRVLNLPSNACFPSQLFDSRRQSGTERCIFTSVIHRYCASMIRSSSDRRECVRKGWIITGISHGSMHEIAINRHSMQPSRSRSRINTKLPRTELAVGCLLSFAVIR